MIKAESSAGVSADVSALLRLMQDPAIQMGQLPTAFVRITELACQHLSVDRASVWLWSDRDPSQLVCQDVCTGREHHQGASLNAESRPLYFAHLWHSRLLACDDLQALQGCADHWCEWQDIYADQVRSVLHVALVDEDQMVGMLCLENAQPRVWQASERTFMLLLAARVFHGLFLAQLSAEVPVGQAED